MRLISLLFGWVWCSATMALAQSPAAEKAYRDAIKAMNSGKPEKGFSLLEKTLGLQPTHHEALYARAFYHFENGADEEALADCKAVLTAYPTDTATYRLRGQVYRQLERYDEAEDDFRKTLSLDKTDFNAYNELGRLYYLKSDYVRARECFAQSLAQKPNGLAYEYQSRMLYNERQFDQALKEVDKELALEPKSADALRMKALVFLGMNKDKEAIGLYAALQKAGQLTEQDLLNWGLIYYYQKKYPQALTYFSILKKHEEPDLYYFKALTEYRMRQPAEALHSIDRAIALIEADDEENASYFYDRAIIKQALSDKTRKPSDAVNDFFQAVYLVPEIVDQRDYNGDTLDLLGSAKQVLKGTYTTQQLDSVRVVGYQQRAEAFADLEQLPNALEAVEKAVQLDSLHGYSYHLRGSYRATSEQYASAIHDFEKALRLPHNPVEDQTYYMRGLTYAGMELYPNAIADFTRAIALNGENADFYFDRAYAYADLGDFGNAIQDMSKAVEMEPSESEYRVSRAGFYVEAEQFDLALEDCQQVLSTEKDNADAYYYRGTAYEGKKNYAMAIQAYTQALVLNPELTEAKESLDEVMIKAGK